MAGRQVLRPLLRLLVLHRRRLLVLHRWHALLLLLQRWLRILLLVLLRSVLRRRRHVRSRRRLPFSKPWPGSVLQRRPLHRRVLRPVLLLLLLLLLRCGRILWRWCVLRRLLHVLRL